MLKIIQLEKEWQDVTSEKSQLSWQHQLWQRDHSLGRNCEAELSQLAAKQEDLAQKIRLARVSWALGCVANDEEEMEFFRSEYDEVADAYLRSDDYQSLVESLSPAAHEALVDWVNIHGHPKGGHQ